MTQALKTQNRKQIIKSLIFHRNQTKSSENIKHVARQLNFVNAIYQDWKETTAEATKSGNFNDVSGLCFNIFYHDFEDTIENVFFEIKSKFQDLHWQKFGFNVYN
jgi:hypothetical protein